MPKTVKTPSGARGYIHSPVGSTDPSFGAYNPPMILSVFKWGCISLISAGDTILLSFLTYFERVHILLQYSYKHRNRKNLTIIRIRLNWESLCYTAWHLPKLIHRFFVFCYRETTMLYPSWRYPSFRLYCFYQIYGVFP